jgi:acyl-CoA reductase-like NAD-dependent aldehyde dehydrogenase
VSNGSTGSAEGDVRLEVDDFFAPAVRTDGDGSISLSMLIDGEWRGAAEGEVFDVYSPIDGSRIGRAPLATTADVEKAIDVAVANRAGFREVPAAQRLSICEQAAAEMGKRMDDFVNAVVVDLGKTPKQAASEAHATQERLKLAREEVRKISGEYLPGDWIGDTDGKAGIVLREPIGTVAAIGPFNYPLFLAASKIIPAIAAGNTVVAKAPSDDPIPLAMFVRVFEEAGLPDGVLNLITGSGSQIGDLLASHDGISMISFTGSTPVGRRIAEQAGPKPLHLELGGNAAAIVLDDADIELAVSCSVMGAYKNAGQRCDAISRVLVERSLYEDFLQRAVKETEDWVCGDPRKDGVQVGPLVNPGASRRVADLVADALDKGAELLAGGGGHDAYYEPTVLGGVPLEADILWEETFGPVVAVTAVDDLTQALEIANASRYGLDSSIFTKSLESAWRAARSLQCGQVHVNDAPAHGVGHFPFGGHKPDSGIGREGLGYSIDECTVLKTIVMPA